MELKDNISLDDFFDDTESVIGKPYIEKSVDFLYDLVDKWLDENCKMGGSFSIDEKELIHIDGDIIFTNIKMKELPSYINFGTIKGSFTFKIDMNNEYEITSLKGFPKKVEKTFIMNNCHKLKSLEGGPKFVGGKFYCSACNSLESLEGGPIYVGKDYLCFSCQSLKTLKGAPMSIFGDFYCFSCPNLESLEEGPKNVSGTYDCSSNNKLTSLKGAPNHVDNFMCSGCINLKSLEGIPQDIYDTLNCYGCGNYFSHSYIQKFTNVRNIKN